MSHHLRNEMKLCEETIIQAKLEKRLDVMKWLEAHELTVDAFVWCVKEFTVLTRIESREWAFKVLTQMVQYSPYKIPILQIELVYDLLFKRIFEVEGFLNDRRLTQLFRSQVAFFLMVYPSIMPDFAQFLFEDNWVRYDGFVEALSRFLSAPLPQSVELRQSLLENGHQAFLLQSVRRVLDSGNHKAYRLYGILMTWMDLHAISECGCHDIMRAMSENRELSGVFVEILENLTRTAKGIDFINYFHLMEMLGDVVARQDIEYAMDFIRHVCGICRVILEQGRVLLAAPVLIKALTKREFLSDKFFRSIFQLLCPFPDVASNVAFNVREQLLHALSQDSFDSRVMSCCLDVMYNLLTSDEVEGFLSNLNPFLSTDISNRVLLCLVDWFQNVLEIEQESEKCGRIVSYMASCWNSETDILTRVLFLGVYSEMKQKFPTWELFDSDEVMCAFEASGLILLEEFVITDHSPYIQMASLILEKFVQIMDVNAVGVAEMTGKLLQTSKSLVLSRKTKLTEIGAQTVARFSDTTSPQVITFEADILCRLMELTNLTEEEIMSMAAVPKVLGTDENLDLKIAFFKHFTGSVHEKWIEYVLTACRTIGTHSIGMWKQQMELILPVLHVILESIIIIDNSSDAEWLLDYVLGITRRELQSDSTCSDLFRQQVPSFMFFILRASQSIDESLIELTQNALRYADMGQTSSMIFLCLDTIAIRSREQIRDAYLECWIQLCVDSFVRENEQFSRKISIYGIHVIIAAMMKIGEKEVLTRFPAWSHDHILLSVQEETIQMNMLR